MIRALLDGLLDWEGRAFLSEEQWSFDIPMKKAEVSSRISSRLATLPEWRLALPIADYSKDLKFRGILENNFLKVKPPRYGLLGNLLGLNMLFYFVGRISDGQSGSNVSGTYKVVPIFRVFLLFFVNLAVFAFVLAIGLSAWFFVTNYGDEAARSAVTACMAVALLALVVLLWRLIRRMTEPSREALLMFFADLAAEKSVYKVEK